MDKFRQAPAKIKSLLDSNIEEKTDALLFSSAFHCLALQLNGFNKRYVVKQFNGASKEGKEEATSAKTLGLELVPTRIYEARYAMAESVRNHPLIGQIMNDIFPFYKKS